MKTIAKDGNLIISKLDTFSHVQLFVIFSLSAYSFREENKYFLDGNVLIYSFYKKSLCK